MPDNNIALIVTIPFGPYAIGDKITDPELIEKALETNEAHVVKIRA